MSIFSSGIGSLRQENIFMAKDAKFFLNYFVDTWEHLYDALY